MFLNPLGLLGLASLIPLIILYIIKPDPRKLEIPTVEFLPNFTEEGGTNPVIESLRRNILLILQILALIFLSLSLATPYIQVSRSAQIDNTVIVLDGSASMATQNSNGESRFSSALSEAKSEITSTTSIVFMGSSTRTLLNKGSAEEARNILNSLSVTGSESDLQSAVSQGASLTSEEAKMVVLSDFANDSDWRTPVQATEARGTLVKLKQFNSGGDSNIGIIDLSFRTNSVTATIKNFGEKRINTEIEFGGQTKSIDLNGGDLVTKEFNVPPGLNTMEIKSSDSLPIDNKAYIAAPSESKIDVLLVTSDGNKFLETAFSSMKEVNLRKISPPVGSFGSPDVIVFTEVNPQRLLDRTIRKAKETAQGGGGVVIQAQSDIRDLQDKYGELLIVQPKEVVTGKGIRVVSDNNLVNDIDFSPPEEYIKANLKNGRALVNSSDGSPILAVSKYGQGGLMYDGFMKDSSNFKYNYLYPVFWKRAIYDLSGRERLSTINMETGSTLSFPEKTKVNTPSGTVTTQTVIMEYPGFYSTETRKVSANLVSPSESRVDVDPINQTQVVKAGSSSSSGTQKVPKKLTNIVAFIALIIISLELIYMKYRGDI